MIPEIDDIRNEHLKMIIIAETQLVRTTWPHCVFGCRSWISNQVGNEHKHKVEMQLLTLLLVDLN